MQIYRKILDRSRQKGFTLVEALLVVGLTTLIAVGIVAVFLEGIDTLHIITDNQSVEFGHQRALTLFLNDVHSATWFYNGTQKLSDGTDVPRETATTFSLIFGYPGSDSDEIWVRYHIRHGTFTGESYLTRTVLTASGHDQGTSIVSTGVANLEFNFFKDDGSFTDRLDQIQKIQMILSLNTGGTTVQREYEASLRNQNQGVRTPPGDFDELETLLFKK